jgi:hypothetical protein
MGYTIDAAGNIIQTSNTGVVGSNFIPNIYEQPIGALNSVGRQMYTENEDGTVTAPTYSLTSNTPTFDIGSMASIYGTKYMPMFEWVSQNKQAPLPLTHKRAALEATRSKIKLKSLQTKWA